MHVSEICVKRIRVNQGLGVDETNLISGAMSEENMSCQPCPDFLPIFAFSSLHTSPLYSLNNEILQEAKLLFNLT